MRQLLALLFTLVLTTPLMGQAEFEANSSFSAEILSAGPGVTFTWEVFPEFEDVFAQGSATGFADATDETSSVMLAIGDVFDLFATTNGTATAFADQIDSTAITLGLLSVENTSSSLQDFSIDVAWSLVADTEVGDAFFQDSLGISAVEIALDFDTELLFETAESISLLDSERDELNDSLSIGIDLEPSQIAEFDFLVDSIGFASNFSVVPEPNGLLGLVLIIVGIAQYRRR